MGGKLMKREIPPGLLSDPAWRAALHVLACPMLNDRNEVWRHVDLAKRSIDFKRMMKGAWHTGGSIRMVKLAASIFTTGFNVNLWSDLGGLDSTNSRVVIEAMKLFAFDPVGDAMVERPASRVSLCGVWAGIDRR
jgi:hypothetical protein